MILCDIACKLDVYCRRREPTFFKKTSFKVDTPHFLGHFGCSICYCIESSRSEEILHYNINSAGVESCNKSLGKARTTTRYMDKMLYTKTLMILLEYQNRKLLKKYDPQPVTKRWLKQLIELKKSQN